MSDLTKILVKEYEEDDWHYQVRVREAAKALFLDIIGEDENDTDNYGEIQRDPVMRNRMRVVLRKKVQAL